MSKTSNNARAKLPLGKSKKPEVVTAACKAVIRRGTGQGQWTGVVECG